MKITLPRRAAVHWPQGLRRVLPWLVLLLLALALTSLAADVGAIAAQGLY